MKRVAKSVCIWALAAFVVLPSAATAHDVRVGGELKDQRAAPAARPTIDPLVQAILIAAAAISIACTSGSIVGRAAGAAR